MKQSLHSTAETSQEEESSAFWLEINLLRQQEGEGDDGVKGHGEHRLMEAGGFN